ncbi:MAG: S8 family serine peptidase [Bacteroidales bacterium]|nr:S8 family serine peptidase [Bacteroidales bacterium]
MKRIEIENSNGADNKPRKSYWGLIWRYLLFLALLFCFLLLLKWLLGLPQSGSYDNDNDDAIDVIGDDHYFDNLDDDIINDQIINIPDYYDPDNGGIDERIYENNPELRDILEEELPGNGGNFSNPIPELPQPNENYLRPISPEDVITPEDDPYKQIDGTSIDVILEDISESNFNNFARRLKQLFPEDNVNIEYYNPEAGLIQIKVDPTEREDVKRKIRENINDIEYKLFDDVLFNASSTASSYNDPAFKNERQSWHFGPIQAYEAWDITQGSSDVVVAVIDSYIDITHPEFKGRVVKPYSVERRSRNVMPPAVPYSFGRDEDALIYHGTHVAGLAVGALNNGAGAAGLAPKCKLMPISLGGNMSSVAILEGMLYAINQGADVINLSIATLFPKGTDKTPLNEQMEYIRNTGQYQEDVWDYVFAMADKKKCTIVWAAGNCNVLSGMDETKRGENTIRVSAVDQSLKKADFSNFGNYSAQGVNYSDISAPGVDIYSAGPANGYGFCPGTSMAAPIVSGAVALIKSVNPDLSNKQIIELLDKTGKVVDRDGHIGKLIQVRDALEAAGGTVANFDKIKADPNSINGVWKTTDERVVTDSETGDPTGEMTHIYLKFNNISSGTIYYKTDANCTYSAPFTSKLNNDKLEIRQQGNANSPTCPRPFAPVVIECVRGENGMLKCRSYYGNNPGSEYYFLVKSDIQL